MRSLMSSSRRNRLRLVVSTAAWLFTSMSCRNMTEPDLSVLRVEPTAARYAPGDTVFVALRNLGLVELVGTTCNSALERWDGASWVSVSLPVTGGSCADIGLPLAPGARVIVRVLIGAQQALPSSLSPGLYRCVLPVFLASPHSDHVKAESEPFSILPPS
jgi:hypothetical protein